MELAYSADAVAYHHYDKDLAAVAQDSVGRGRNDVLFGRKHPEVKSHLRLGAGRGSRRRRVLRGALLSASDYLQATRARGRFRRGMAEVMTRVDLIAMPTSAMAAERFDDPSVVPYGRTSFTRIFNITGQPAITLPLHWSADGLPVGLQFVGRFGDEDTLMKIAAQLEQAAPWAQRRAPVHG